jgi:Tol biopolymer transport system component/tRNA A-37 threonylcarbamoyl transferase component Bud32
MIGQLLRHYRIESKLGSGGMGEVYRARDTRLDRMVAIKVLLPSALSNPERKRRFMHEAKTASALNHPNIVTIHEVDTATTEDGEPIDFIAMEYVQGKTIDQLMGKKPLRVEEVLRYGAQIADALASAHAAGVVHRDLKPANIMITEQGNVKLLDFGLAKLTEPFAASAFAATESIHIQASQMTEQGTILGTVAYMSPEQAEGRRMDARSDIFSFGTVLYEMASGRQAFIGDSKLSTLASILQKDPPSPSAAGVAMPQELEHLILRCLRKEPERRWQSAADLKVSLDDLRAEVDSGELVELKTAPSKPFGLARWLWLALAGLALAAAGLWAGRALFFRPSPSFVRLTFRLGEVTGARFAPDTHTIVYSARWSDAPTTVYSTRLGSRESRSLDLPVSRLLAVSSSGELALLLGTEKQGTLARVPLAGGSPREILEDVFEADWSPDGAKLAVIRRVGVNYRVEYPIGTVLFESHDRSPRLLHVSPAGDKVAFVHFDPEVVDAIVTVVNANASPAHAQSLSTGWFAIGHLDWSPNGKEIWFSGLHTGEDPKLRAVDMAGKERVILETPNWILPMDFGANGRLLALDASTRIGISYMASADSGEKDLSWLDSSRLWEISADGKYLLFAEISYGRGRNTAIYLRKTDGSPPVRLGEGGHPSLSPDGKHILSIRYDGSKSDLVMLPVGAGEPRVLSTQGLNYEYGEWFPDGKRILFVANKPGQPARSYVQALDGGLPIAITAEDQHATQVSPDGHVVLVLQGDKLNLQPVDASPPRVLAGADIRPGDAVIRWTADGNGIYLRRIENETTANILRLELATGKTTLLHKLHAADPTGTSIFSVSITPDGHSYGYSYQRELNTLYLVDGLK